MTSPPHVLRKVQRELTAASADQGEGHGVGKTLGRNVKDRVVPLTDGVVAHGALTKAKRARHKGDQAQQSQAEAQRPGAVTRFHWSDARLLLGLTLLLLIGLPVLTRLAEVKPKTSGDQNATHSEQERRALPAAFGLTDVSDIQHRGVVGRHDLGHLTSIVCFD